MGTILVIIYLLTIIIYAGSLTVLTVTKDETWGIADNDDWLIACLIGIIPLVNMAFTVAFIGQIFINRSENE